MIQKLISQSWRHLPQFYGHPVRLAGVALTAGFVVALNGCSSSPTPPTAETSPSLSPTAESAQASPQVSVSPMTEANKSEVTTAIEKALTSNLSKQLGVPVKSVTCPSQEKLAAGLSFDCNAEIAEGTFPVNVTMKDTQGRFSLKTRQLVLLARVESLLQDAIKQQNKLDVKANCGDGKVKFFQKVGETFTCKLTNPSGKMGSATVTITSEEGNVDAKWSVPS